MPARVTDGALTATVGTEHIVWEDVAANGTYQLMVDRSALASGETIVITIYRRTRTTDPIRPVYIGAYRGPGGTRAGDEPLIMTTPVMTTDHLRFTLRQLNGTGRTFPFVVEKA